MAVVRRYAEAVYAESERFFATASDEDLSGVLEKHMAARADGKPVIELRRVPAWQVFLDDVVLHMSEHTGEIAALLGVKGHKGSYWG